ncbi:ras association domain-containing protein 10 [Eublepharis macularius]|uniref:Ras association domain-containing protein 10 n=1 Tax=Eublepharis macularius TaxID=481883 RepID=A0AA97IYH7_EUBMA|nr:ras association domain-containing protein 10 [Eublepharis macularius]
MEPEEKKISVWICQEEKLISGLSKRTTCSDVVRVLLDDSRRRRQEPEQEEQQQQLGSLQECGEGMLAGPPQSYCIVEKWRGFERILPNKTKILRLWAAWGDEQENVRFVLVRSEASLPNTGPRSAEARVVPSKDSPCHHGLGTAARASLALSQERQRRVVRKAFRKLAKINKRRGPPPHEEPPAKEASAAERMETLVHLVLSQDHTIRQQVKRIRELDREIDRYEAKVHFDRMKRHGVNYVQDTYLVGGEAELSEGAEETEQPTGGEGAAGGDRDRDQEEYAWQWEQVARLQEQWRRQEELVEQLAGEIQQELNERWMKRRREELAAARGSSASLSETDCNTTELIGGDGGGELHVEQERVKTQLSTSLYIGLRLSTDLEAVKTDLESAQRSWADKERELQRLLDTLRALEVEQEEAPPGPSASPQRPEDCGRTDAAPIPSEVWGEQAARGLGKDCEENDEDSDTGLSSMHSQDSDSVPVCESLV